MAENKKETTEIAEVVVGVDANAETTTSPTVKEDEKKSAAPRKAVSIRSMFRFASWSDTFLMFFGALMGLANGSTQILNMLVLGDLFDAFNDPTSGGGIGEKALDFVYVAIAAMFAATFQVLSFTIASERMTVRLRTTYLKSVLNQDIAFFDVRNSGELASSVAENSIVFRDALGDKLGTLFQFVGMFLSGFILGFVQLYSLALVILATAPLLAICGFLMMKIMGDLTMGQLKAYAEAGAIAEESISQIRTVAGLGMEKERKATYQRGLEVAVKTGIKSSTAQGVAIGMTLLIMFCSYGLGFWYGGTVILNDQVTAANEYPPNPLISAPFCAIGQPIPSICTLQETNGAVFESQADICNCPSCLCGCWSPQMLPGDLKTSDWECATGGSVIITFFAILIGAMSIGQAAPAIAAFSNGRSAAYAIYEIIDRVPEIGGANHAKNKNKSGSDGEKLAEVRGEIALEDVHYTYAARPDAPVFKGLSLAIPSGKTVALVGESGSGKSTVISLIERFYDPSSGKVTMDGVDIKTLDPRWYRSLFGYVGQEPTLFATSIKQNILFGTYDSNVSHDRVVAAAKAANAHEFIMSFPNGYDTLVGGGGSQLSGGQKQRIAIARALIRDPTVLLLDEATSALDNESERIVQSAIDEMISRQKRTTIIVAHRLSTIKNADVIVVLGRGKVLEQGNHESLLANGGTYAALVSLANKGGHGAGASSSSRRKVSTIAKTESSAKSEADSVSVRSFDIVGAVGVKRNSIDEAQEENKRHGEEEDEEEQQPQPESSQDDDVEVEIARKMSHQAGPVAETFGMIAKGAKDVVSIPDGDVPLLDSEKKKKKKNKKDKNTEKKEKPIPISRVWTFAKEDRVWFLPGFLAAAVNGVTFPVFAIIFSNMSDAYFQISTEQLKADTVYWALLFVALGAATGLSNFLQIQIFGIIGSRMTARVRSATFDAVIRKDIGYFDLPENSVGGIVSTLATDASLVKAAIVDRTAVGIMNMVTIISGLIVAFVASWQVTLVVLAVFPVLVIAAAAQMMAMTGMAINDQGALSLAGGVLSESILGIRTVTALGLNDRVIDLYAKYLDGPMRAATKKGVTQGVAFGFGQSVPLLANALAFWYGGELIKDGTISFQQLLQSFFGVMMMSIALGQNTALAADIAKGGPAVKSIFRLLDAGSKIDPLSNEGEKPSEFLGDIEFSDVSFYYPARPTVQVMKSFNLTIHRGETVALVGASGSGKSTIVLLLERFYDLAAGVVKVDGRNIKDLNTAWLRAQMGYVGQEPQLFVGTIAENIRNGRADATMEEIIEAAKNSNAYDFIMSFPDKFDTKVGSKGTQLSGGQKQRIAISRAILRNPRLLLLDEATSALDGESERVVQAALDDLLAKQKRTTIVVAHRLSTVQNANNIVVLDKGVVVESGVYGDLLSRPNGAFAKLYAAQQKQKS